MLPQYGLEYLRAYAKIIQIDAGPKMLGLVEKITLEMGAATGQAATALNPASTGHDAGL